MLHKLFKLVIYENQELIVSHQKGEIKIKPIKLNVLNIVYWALIGLLVLWPLSNSCMADIDIGVVTSVSQFKSDDVPQF